MIVLNGKKFASSEKELTNSLFDSGGTCVGFYTRYKRQVKLFNMQRELIGVINKYGVLSEATRLDDGTYWYSYRKPSLIGEYTTRERMNDISNISIDQELVNDEKECWFK